MRLANVIPTSTPSVQGCVCHSSAGHMATAFPQEQALVIRKRMHGTLHTGIYGLDELVKMLDPTGTSYVAVGSA